MPAEQFKNIEIIKQIAIFWIVQVQGFELISSKTLHLPENAFPAKQAYQMFYLIKIFDFA